MHEDEDLPLLLLSDKTIEVLIALSDAESTCTMRRRKLLSIITTLSHDATISTTILCQYRVGITYYREHVCEPEDTSYTSK